ncbi:hypothetical protein Y032_0088g2118 [Ancylostoma ceylanicum]|uniref:G-protein coupled receptors family 1 profile domain-containing protein n=1 Tax=Ancylostoma ceylanicum TaxID=53326 RepID=A0A016TMR5_9BILA|nr:hypothetical protein Y032_0088g2118 [Ancylostoma ceylanicum]
MKVFFSGPYLFVGICTVVNAIITSQDETLVLSFCLTVNAVSRGFYDYILLLRISCISFSAIAYVLIIARLNKQFARMAKIQVGRRESHQFDSIRRSTVTVGLSTANAVVFLLIPDIIKYIGIYDYSKTYVTILFSLSMTNVILNALIFSYRHMEILTSLKQILCSLLRYGPLKIKHKNGDITCKVVPMSSRKAHTITHTAA